MSLDEILAKLRAASDLLDAYAVKRIGVFGSVARGEAGPDSDVDLLVEFDRARYPGLEFFALERELADLLGRRVDLIAAEELTPRLKVGVARDLVPV
jgi:predicted nucleotidyltransferase